MARINQRVSDSRLAAINIKQIQIVYVSCGARSWNSPRNHSDNGVEETPGLSFTLLAFNWLEL